MLNNLKHVLKAVENLSKVIYKKHKIMQAQKSKQYNRLGLEWGRQKWF